MQLRARLDRAESEKAGLERILAAMLGVITDDQFSQVRARLDAEDARVAEAAR